MDVESLYLRGKEAADAGNYDYAIEIFLDVLRVAPDHRNSRIALRGSEMEKFREKGGGLKAKLLAFLKGLGHLLMMKLAAKNHEKALHHCERYLVNDPTSIGVLMRLAQACEALGHLEAAADTLEFARQRKPDRLKVLRRLGQVRYQLGEYDKAVRCYQHIQSIRPQDQEAPDKIREIQAVAHLKKSHMGEAQTYREVLRDSDKAEALEGEQHIARTADEADIQINRLKKAFEASPDDYNALIALGDAYYRFERYADAEQIYRKAFQVGKKYDAREKLGNAHIARFRHFVQKAEKQAQDSGRDPAKVAAAQEARRKMLDFCVKEYAFRRKQHPTDMKLAWELGRHYFELGGQESVEKAIPQFQQAMSNPALKSRAQYMLGRCFRMNPKTLDMARDQLLATIEATESDTSDFAKAVTYELAAVLEDLGKKDEALNYYKKIFAVDAAFRSVSRKIQELG